MSVQTNFTAAAMLGGKKVPAKPAVSVKPTPKKVAPTPVVVDPVVEETPAEEPVSE